MAKTSDMRSAFRKEYEIARDFDHDGLLHYMDFDTSGDLPFMVMDSLVACMLEKDPAQRLSSVTDFLRRFEKTGIA